VSQRCGRARVGIDEEAKEGRQFNLDMPGTPLHLGKSAGIREQVEHLLEQMPGRHVDAVGRHRAGGATVPHVEGVLQNPREARGKLGPWMIALATPEEMAQTGLIASARGRGFADAASYRPP